MGLRSNITHALCAPAPRTGFSYAAESIWERLYGLISRVIHVKCGRDAHKSHFPKLRNRPRESRRTDDPTDRWSTRRRYETTGIESGHSSETSGVLNIISDPLVAYRMVSGGLREDQRVCKRHRGFALLSAGLLAPLRGQLDFTAVFPFTVNFIPET